ncbi:MAG: hypothetical protein DCC49_08355 [Acidobacteria bacterium]|nr:MAG: hypothetical protein DCC49_08355 [Acidobacteriota bacterium]
MKVIDSGESSESLEDPKGQAWQGLSGETLALEPAPVDGQPSRYVAAAYQSGAPTGASEVDVIAVRSSGGDFMLRLSWPDGDPDIAYGERKFPDAAAVMFPASGDAPLQEMGSPDQPVNLWYWRPDLDGECQALTATGLGSVERADGGGLSAKSAYDDGKWMVVFRNQGGDVPGKAAVAVWEGGAGQRGGLKSVTGSWQNLEDAQ